MNNEAFRKSLDPVRSKLAEIDALVASSGSNFNEAAQEKAASLVDDLADATAAATSAATDLLEAQLHEEEVLQPGDEEVEDDAPDREPQEGDVFVIEGGKPVRVVREKDAPVDDGIVAQGDQLAPHPDPITATAMASIEAGIERARVKDGKAPAGIATAQVSADEKTVQLATSEGAEQTHFLEDASKLVQDGDEPVKVVTSEKDGNAAADSLNAGEGAQFTPAPDADKAGDEAALEAGRQEVIPAVVAQPEPGDAGNLSDNPGSEAQGSGSERYEQPKGDDWTAVGMTASGAPCDKGSDEDVTPGIALAVTAPVGDIQAGDIVTLTATTRNIDLSAPTTYSFATDAGPVDSTGSVAIIDTTGLAPGAYTVKAHVEQEFGSSSADASTTFVIVG